MHDSIESDGNRSLSWKECSREATSNREHVHYIEAMSVVRRARTPDHALIMVNGLEP